MRDMKEVRKEKKDYLSFFNDEYLTQSLVKIIYEIRIHACTNSYIRKDSYFVDLHIVPCIRFAYYLIEQFFRAE